MRTVAVADLSPSLPQGDLQQPRQPAPERVEASAARGCSSAGARPPPGPPRPSAAMGPLWGRCGADMGPLLGPVAVPTLLLPFAVGAKLLLGSRRLVCLGFSYEVKLLAG